MGFVRIASHADVPELAKLVESYHSTRSNLKDIPFDNKSMIATFDYYIGMKKHIVYVYQDDVIKGFIMGSVEPFPHNRNLCWAGDTMFIAEAGGSYLLRRFFSWARAMKAKRVYMAVSTGESAADALYKASGMEYTGGMYRVVY